MQQISLYFAPVSAPRTTFNGRSCLAAIWVAGSLFLLIRWCRNWRETKTAVLEPGVFGIFHPVLAGTASWVSSEPYDVTLTPYRADVATGPGSSLKDVTKYENRNLGLRLESKKGPVPGVRD